MNIINYENGRLILLKAWDDLRPAYGWPLKEILNSIWERYNFTSRSDINQAIAEGTQIEFTGGTFMLEGQKFGVRVGFHNDGLVIDCSTTESAQAFLQDLIVWGHENFGMGTIKPGNLIVYSSTIIFEPNQQALEAFHAIDPIVNLMQTAVAETYGLDEKIEIETLRFSPDPTKMNNVQSFAHFTIERRASVPFAMHRFYSLAPLPTATHVSLLEKIESVLSKPNQ